MFLTVLTPTYNRSDKLHRVFNSIHKQTLKQINNKYIFEWVIVDDGSSDNTKSIVTKWQNEVDWNIKYIYQNNKGKPWAIAKGLEYIDSEWVLIADSDDEFVADTFETFYNTINQFKKSDIEKLSGIGVLCQDQYGNRVGSNFPIEKEIYQNLKHHSHKDFQLIGESWAILKTKNLKYAFLDIPKEAKKLKFIPESYFWNRINYELNPYSYSINKVLRIYYKNEDDNISIDIRKKYPDGFLFESKHFLKYTSAIIYNPKLYIKHLLKYIYFTFILIKNNITKGKL